MELSEEEKQIVINILSQVSLPVNQAPQVLAIIEKLKRSLTKKEKI